MPDDPPVISADGTSGSIHEGAVGEARLPPPTAAEGAAAALSGGEEKGTDLSGRRVRLCAAVSFRTVFAVEPEAVPE